MAGASTVTAETFTRAGSREVPFRELADDELGALALFSKDAGFALWERRRYKPGRSLRFNPHHGKDGKFGSGGGGPSGGFTRDQFEAMVPGSMWTDAKRQTILSALKKTPSGAVLADTLDSFQDGGSVARLRTSVDKRLKGESDNPTRAARADAVIGALRAVPHDIAPAKLFRGMTVKGTEANVLSKYRSGDKLDLNLTSFTTDRKVAVKFQGLTSNRGKARVMVELQGGNKSVLPIQNLARDRRLFKEKEWVGGGQYRITEAKKSPSGGIILRVEQVATL